MNSLFLKHFSLTAILVVFSFTILGASFVFLGRTFAINERKDNIAVNAEAVSQTAAAFSENGLLYSLNFRLIVDTVAKSTGNQIFVTDDNGMVFASSDPDINSSKIGKQISPDILETIRQNSAEGKVTTMDSFRSDVPFYVVATSVMQSVDGAAAAYIFVGSDFSSIVDAWAASSKLFILMAIVIMFLALFMSYMAARRQSEPINEMAAAASRFARGDFSARVTNYGASDEVGALTESFNSMAESLEKSEQLRSEFIANVSHELKTPMTTISGFADGILDGTIPQNDQAKYLATISSETKRLSRLVRQMLQMSRIQTVDTQALLSHSFDLSELIMRTLLTFEDKITERGLDVDPQIPEESIIVRGDGDSFTQVVYNLLDNAMKFAEQGSTIGISLWKQDGKAFVSVKNNGECISPEELPFIFDRFQKTDKSRSLDRDGVGLGLSIVKTILSNHGENITVTSRDRVTEFIFSAKLKN